MRPNVYDIRSLKKIKVWPNTSPVERRLNLLDVWSKILKVVRGEGGEINILIQEPISLKPVEDAIDVIACACVGHQFINCNIQTMGGGISAIWMPLSKSEEFTINLSRCCA